MNKIVGSPWTFGDSSLIERSDGTTLLEHGLLFADRFVSQEEYETIRGLISGSNTAYPEIMAAYFTRCAEKRIDRCVLCASCDLDAIIKRIDSYITKGGSIGLRFVAARPPQDLIL